MECSVYKCIKEAKAKDKYCSMHRARITRHGMTDQIREFTILKKLKHNKNGCKEWTGYLTEWGYGRVRYRGKKMLAHRVIWEIMHEGIPEGMLVLHKCDNPSCCNIDHLFLGTHKDNFDDAVSKGRVNPSQRGKERWIKCPTLRKKS